MEIEICISKMTLIHARSIEAVQMCSVNTSCETTKENNIHHAFSWSKKLRPTRDCFTMSQILLEYLTFNQLAMSSLLRSNIQRKLSQSRQ